MYHNPHHSGKTHATKIVATIGPACMHPGVLDDMIHAGLNVARINFSHGDHESHGEEIKAARHAAHRAQVPVAIIQDLSGPKIRIGDFLHGHIVLEKGKPFTLTTKKIVGDETQVYVNYHHMPREIKPGAHILLDDGKRDLRVDAVRGEEIHTTVIVGGEIRSRRGVNLPGTRLSIPALTAKDKKDLVFGLEQGVDFVALSFVHSAHDIVALKKRIADAGSSTRVIAKIETAEGLADIEEIAKVADAIMVARGDLAVEIPKEEVPLAQKTIIRVCNRVGIPVITATQMLDSMTTHPVPTRAEVSDVANAIFDGTDAVMLSGETAIGIDPAHVVREMAEIAYRTETSEVYRETIAQKVHLASGIVDAVTASVARVAHRTEAKAIVAFTESGFTARMVSRHKPGVPIVALSPKEDVYRALALSYGCVPVHSKEVLSVPTALSSARRALTKRSLAKEGDTFVLVAGMPFGITGGTNSLIVQNV